MSAPHIVLGVTGSIAAYKSAELVRRMRDRGWDVSVIMTEAAGRFIGALTLQTLSGRPVASDLFDSTLDWRPEHIALADRGDVMLIAPCTANFIGKLANGIADDLLSCVGMAARCPIVIAPAMNERMWESGATRDNVRRLRERGCRFVDVEEGDLACGVTGKGRLAGIPAILDLVTELLEARTP